MGQITESASQWKINECLNYNSETSTSLQESKNDSKNRTTLFRNFKRLSPTTRALAPRQWYNEGFMSEADFDRHIREECYDLELKIAECLLNKLNMKQKMTGNLANFFDYEGYGRELFNRDYSMGANGNVFRRI